MQKKVATPLIAKSTLQTNARSLLDIDLSDEQVTQFERLTDLLLEWNQRMNLTGITDRQEIDIKHHLDSLTLVKVMPPLPGLRLIDVGTGAGFPGLPLAIAFPAMIITLMDATGKKLRFIDHVKDALGLDNIRTLHARAEDAGRNKSHRESYHLVVARAVTRLPALMEYCLPLTKPEGQVIVMKGASAFDETAAAARAIDELGGELFTIEEIRLPTLDNPRYLIVVDKIERTPRRYPRNAGIPTREPIL